MSEADLDCLMQNPLAHELFGAGQKIERLTKELAHWKSEHAGLECLMAEAERGAEQVAFEMKRLEKERDEEKAKRMKAEDAQAVLANELARQIPQGPIPVTRYQKYAMGSIPVRVRCRVCEHMVNLKEYGTPRDPSKAMSDLSWHGPGCLWVQGTGAIQNLTPAAARARRIVKAAESHEEYRRLGSAAYVSIEACDCGVCKAVRGEEKT